jgi:ribosomal protein S18 acetylase RimI-like enzyme
MKRLYLRPQARGAGLGRSLAAAAVAHARERGFSRVVLDTMPEKMHEAVALYRSMGFRDAAPYLQEPTPGALCLELTLR